jgi:putative IMPACT (imprinted ancient) family translation regulator
MDKDFIPRSCDECIKSKYKRPMPDCAHEQGIAHKKTYKFFLDKYGITINQHVEEMKRCKQEREQCLQQIQQQAREMVALRQGLGIDQIFSSISKLSERVNDIENNDAGNESKDRILAYPKHATDEEQTTKTIIQKKRKEPQTESMKAKEPDAEKQPKEPKKNLSMAERGWLTYIRNCKKENVKKYVDQLKKEHPDITDNQIDIGINGAGNRMIRYTLNPDLAHN